MWGKSPICNAFGPLPFDAKAQEKDLKERIEVRAKAGLAVAGHPSVTKVSHASFWGWNFGHTIGLGTISFANTLTLLDIVSCFLAGLVLNIGCLHFPRY